MHGLDEIKSSLTGRRVLFISYNGMLDPLGQSQVLPYLRALSRRGVNFTLLSFERNGAFDESGRARCEELRQKLLDEGIDWHWLRYHQKPSLPATAYDVLAGTRVARKLIRKNKIELVHARSHIPATIALALKRRCNIKMIFDIRGLMAEEYADAGHWRKEDIAYRLTKKVERQLLTETDGVVVLTERIWPEISKWDGLRERDVIHEVVPCCVDLERFQFRPEQRIRVRQELGIQDQLVLVYSGSIGGWYQSDSMADFFLKLRQQRSGAHFLWLTTGDHKLLHELMREREISLEQYTIRNVESADVPSYLSAADAGIAFYKPGFSKLATSPVKVTEYLACGLPIVINAGIGDSEQLAIDEGVGTVVSEFSPAAYEHAVVALEYLVDRVTETRSRARAVAEKYFDLERVGAARYLGIYEAIFRS